MPREAATTEEPSAAARDVPPTPLSSSQMRVLLNALMRTPVGVVQQVGFLLMLFVAVIEARLPDSRAPPTASIAGRATATAARGHAVVTADGQEWSAKVVAFAKGKQARGGCLMGEGGKVKVRPKGLPNVKVDTLRRWAVRRNRTVSSLLHLLEATPDIGIGDALLLQYHAEGIASREAGKALSAAAAALTYVTRVSGDAIAKARAETTDSNELGEESKGANVLQEPHHHGANAEHLPPEDNTTAEVAAPGTRTAVIRVQALVRGVVARRGLRTANAAATLVQAHVRARTARHEAACRSAISAAAVRVQPAAPVVVQAVWRGVMSRDARLNKMFAAVTVQRWTRLTIVVKSLARTRAIAQAQGANVLQFATVCAEYRFRVVCNLSISMSAYSHAYRTAATLVQRRWGKEVKTASLAARCHVFGQAEVILRSLIRRRSQQAGFDGVVRSPNVGQCASKSEGAITDSTSPKMVCLEAEDESWLEAAQALSEEERSRVWGRSDGDHIGDSSCSNDIDGAAIQRSLDVRLLNEAGTNTDWAGDTPSGGSSINDLPTPTSESPPTSDSVASSNRSSHDVCSSTLLCVGQLGSPSTSPTYANHMEHPQPNNISSSQLSSDGRSDNMCNPPDRGRPVRLPLDEPELSFAQIPIVFDLAPDVTMAPSPGRDGPVGGSVSPPTNDGRSATDIHPGLLDEAGSDTDEAGDASDDGVKTSTLPAPAPTNISSFSPASFDNSCSSLMDIGVLGPQSTSATRGKTKNVKSNNNSAQISPGELTQR